VPPPVLSDPSCPIRPVRRRGRRRGRRSATLGDRHDRGRNLRRELYM